MLNLIKRFMPPIASFQIELYEHEGPLRRTKLQIVFVDGSTLYVKEYAFSDGSRKYAYHWANVEGKLLVRWDNAEHWPELPTFPHHRHSGADGSVHSSTATNLEAVLKQIVAVSSFQTVL